MPKFKKDPNSDNDTRTTTYKGLAYKLTWNHPHFGRSVYGPDGRVDFVTSIKEGERLVKFHGELAMYVKELGAKTSTQGSYLLKTPLGPLRIAIRTDAVMCRFEDVDKALVFMAEDRMNPHSGKWNFHFTIDSDLDSMIATFKSELTRVMKMGDVTSQYYVASDSHTGPVCDGMLEAVGQYFEGTASDDPVRLYRQDDGGGFYRYRNERFDAAIYRHQMAKSGQALLG